MTDEELTQLVDQHVHALMEHFEAVHILASRASETEDATTLVSRGAGNYYARKGMIVEWVENQQAQTIAHEIDRYT